MEKNGDLGSVFSSAKIIFIFLLDQNIFLTSSMAAVPNLFGTMDRFHGRQFFHGPVGKDGFEMIQAH